MSNESVAVLGLGLIGGSIGLALRPRGIRVQGYDPNPAHRTLAADRGLVDYVCASLGEAVAGVSAVILAAPVGAIVDLLHQVDALAPADALILDTGSVKRPVMAAMRALPGARRAVGGHPIAGDERSGPAASNPDLFSGRLFVLCPHDQTSEGALSCARSIVATLGGRSIVMTPDEHDRVLARTSHLPQVLASALALALEPGDPDVAGTGLRDMTRLAASDPTVWRDILLLNGDEVVAAMRRCAAEMSRLAALIELGDADGIAGYVEAGRSRLELVV